MSSGMRNHVVIGVVFGFLWHFAAERTANAQGFTYDALDTCTTINCSAKTIQGSYYSTGTTQAAGLTFVHQVFCAQGECCRIHVTWSSLDTEMAVVSPDPAAFAASDIGNIWADDDAGGGANPLIKIDPVPRTGRYTIIISAYAAGNASAPFTLRYGRYNSGNANCTPPTDAGFYATPYGFVDEQKPYNFTAPDRAEEER